MGTSSLTTPSWLRGGIPNVYFESTAQVRFEAHAPREAEGIWREYLDGLVNSYRAHGIENALDLDSIWLGDTSPIVLVAIDENDRVVAGVRAHGPLGNAHDAHAVGEFVSNPTSQAKVIDLIEERLLFGVVELKAGWVSEEFPRKRELANALARSYIHFMDMLGVQYAFCTSAVHAAKRWATGGAVAVEGLEPVPYPDDRYLTTMMWWNRQTIAQDASAEQWSLIRREAAALRGMQLVGSGRAAASPAPVQPASPAARVDSQVAYRELVASGPRAVNRIA